ncbi:hypothetical protein FRC18_003550 [Serendipita sp. 400]|nr:hypothetical protein FRC18_003550 [Serendipita sp. 400]
MHTYHQYHSPFDSLDQFGSTCIRQRSPEGIMEETRPRSKRDDDDDDNDDLLHRLDPIFTVASTDGARAGPLGSRPSKGTHHLFPCGLVDHHRRLYIGCWS